MTSDTPLEDRNFDDLADRFARNIQNSLKGQIRFAVVERDLEETVPELIQGKPLRILDAGGGLGAFALQLARQGHELVYCDISGKMLNMARQQAEQEGLADRLRFYHEPVQTLIQRDQQFDLILFHAVLEWLANPRDVLDQILTAMGPGTKLSLLFYNERSIVFRNLLRGNFFRAISDTQRGDKGSLTPLHPLNPDDVRAWIAAHDTRLLCESGVRTFFDYAEKPRLARRTPEQIMEMEIRFSRQLPYRELGRYYHLVIDKQQVPYDR